MTSCIVSICREGILASTGSDLTGVAGGVDECVLRAELDNDAGRDLPFERDFSF